MRFTRLSSIGLLACGLGAGSVRVSANEHGGGGGGETAAEAGEAGGEGKAVKPPRDQREYTEKNTKANTLAGKVEEAEKRFRELVHEKEEARGAARAPILKEMVEVSKQREKDEKELVKLRTELQQRYPNQGTHVNRHQGSASSEGHEAAAGPAAAPTLDDLVRDTKSLMDRQYRLGGDHAESEPRAPASEKPVLRPRLRLER